MKTRTRDKLKIVTVGMLIIISFLSMIQMAKGSEHQDTLDSYYKNMLIEHIAVANKTPAMPPKRINVRYSIVTLRDGIVCVEATTVAGGVDIYCDMSEYHKQQRKALEKQVSL